MKRIFPELAGWSFEVTEQLAGAYEATGSDSVGHRVQTTGTDCEALLHECREMAAKVAAESRCR